MITKKRYEACPLSATKPSSTQAISIHVEEMPQSGNSPWLDHSRKDKVWSKFFLTGYPEVSDILFVHHESNI